LSYAPWAWRHLEKREVSGVDSEVGSLANPLGSMYGILFTNIWFILMVNVSKYTIQGLFGNVTTIRPQETPPQESRSLRGLRVEKSHPKRILGGSSHNLQVFRSTETSAP